MLQLDDEEFQLPPVGEMPTLESILNENDPASVSDDELTSAAPPHPKVSTQPCVGVAWWPGAVLGLFRLVLNYREGGG